MIELCPKCGHGPGWNDFAIECKIPNAERKYFCCGVECGSKKIWNRYAISTQGAKSIKDSGITRYTVRRLRDCDGDLFDAGLRVEPDGKYIEYNDVIRILGE